jgi:von Willebrand factor type A domain
MREAIVGVLWIASIAAGCSSSDGDNGNGAGGPGSGSGGQVIFNNPGGGNGPLGPGPGNGCVSDSAATEAAPLDIYVMFDQSCSMSCPPEQAGPGLCCIGGPRPRIDQVRSAMNQFLQNPKSAGISVGLGYFGNFPIGAASCNAADYARPAVPIAPLPGNAQALINSLNQAQPTGETPTPAAINGACQYATQWKSQNPGHALVILLVTDGVPEAPQTRTCKPTLQDAQAAAQACSSQQGISTYVLGVGANLDNLQAIAQAGGTTHAYLAGGTTDISGSVLDALNQIRDSAAVPCKFKIPPPPNGQALDPNRVNVTYNDAGGTLTVIPGAGTAQNCASGGWFYDNPQAPSTVELCPSSCNDVTAALIAGSVLGKPASISLQFGCATQTNTH